MQITPSTPSNPLGLNSPINPQPYKTAKSENQSETEIPPLPDLKLIKTSLAPKTGTRSTGDIGYRILANDNEVFVALTQNSNGGYFSRECVPFTRILDTLTSVQEGQPIRSKMLKHAFTGKSANNSGFLAAVLKKEGLIEVHPEKAHLHTVPQHSNLTNWYAKMMILASTAEPLSETVITDQIKTSENHGGSKKKKPFGKKPSPTILEDIHESRE